MLNLEITYDSFENIIFIKNNSVNFTGALWFSITDSETNLNVTHWWMNIAPNETMQWSLPDFYYSNVKQFKVNVMDEIYNLLLEREFKLKKIVNKINFISKNSLEITYGSWESLVHKNEYNISLKNSDIVYDLGMNVGTFSFWSLSKKVNYVYAFEADNECVKNAKVLFENYNNIEIFNKAILDKDDKINFYIHEHSIANSIFNKSENVIEIESINLENFINFNSLKKPTIIKCDIEGSEYKFIEKLSDNFFETIRIFILEFHLLTEECNNNLFSLIKKFLKLNYTLRLTEMSDFKNNVGTLIFEKPI